MSSVWKPIQQIKKDPPWCFYAWFLVTERSEDCIEKKSCIVGSVGEDGITLLSDTGNSCRFESGVFRKDFNNRTMELIAYKEMYVPRIPKDYT